MAVTGTKEFEIKADPETVMAALAAVERLPEWSSAHKTVAVETTYPDGRPHRVRMTLSILGINDEQVVDYSFDGDDSIEWSLVESSQQNAQDGKYVLTPSDKGTKVEFELTVDPKIPLPGFLVKKAQKTALETASKGLTKFVESL
ncbi:SRPBCC family protein [Rhodococcus triatomae]|uniref:Polyketide cyclase / dehydrase and lipid transport n=1 Tax=Rhodococcus triatomae TaxID=300028 RepID=A0A1G8MZZ1_9NOCA|nr:SRPBCC family protein [Rhodococcus triatomae]QNG19139.1 SRPBCC family protein [Rhodococcus triatomae]QNG24949.1 SRPBCC family protein [Rhodococcus triatomae]SDI73435.1 Polyketide cyclase / dehydrase and lipid transport [Rhodococcus triatomae]